MSFNFIKRVENINLFQGKERISFLHLSDLHLCFSKYKLKQIEHLFFSTPYDVIICTGDYYDTPFGAKYFHQFLNKLGGHCPIILIRGNHDRYWWNKLLDRLSGIKNCFIVDEMIHQLRSPSGFNYHFAEWSSRHHLPTCENNKNIILMHNPEDIDVNDLHNIDIIFAGHLHGGQWILFETKDRHFSPGNLFYSYCCDRMRIGNTTLIVSKGLGDLFPVRINCPKEVVHINIF